jgi:class 3 adenylate cyclase/tetratricopeptide (TPR) repeat protein
MPACPVCATENPDIARFCLACGAALSEEPRREERKVVTVLFADLVGFTSRAEQLDPEDVRAVLAPYWERLRTELERRGGTVEKFIGDAVMALFGAPVAHEDDPLRAVGAALAIRDWAREEADVQVRIAVNTGEALVLLGARPAEGEGMAAGDVVNTAARLQSAAPVNGVLVGETTYRATRDVIEYRERAPVDAKGKVDPVPVWEAVQVRSRLGVDVERATLPIVGRVRELGVILDAFDRAKSEREPQLVTLVGVPGIGKSRLVGEFFSRLEQQPDLVWWRQGRALPYGEGVSFWALAEMVKAQAGIEENDPLTEAEQKLRASVDHVVDEDERVWVLEHLLPLVGGHPRGAGKSLPAWRRYFERLAEQRPLVMVFEDMHWADEGLLDFIDHLVDWANGVPLLVLATARPELLERRNAWGGGKLNVATIALTPLSDDESAQIIHSVLERTVLPADTQQALLERAGGNPLYAEQFARLYLERGTADDLPMPETVQGLIAARIDGLNADEKRALQEAAVFGKVFWAGAVAATEESLHSLERNGMLRRERRSAVAGETQYAFRHVLVRDVAYGQIPRAARGEKHVRAADWIESLGRTDDQAELVAHHLAAALELGLDVRDRARVAFRRAGDRAAALGAFPSAERYYTHALESWPADDPERPYLLAAHARVRFRTTADDDALGTALDALEAAGLVEEAGDLAAFAANAYWYGGKLEEAGVLLARGRALLEGRPPSAAFAALLHESARNAIFQERFEDAAVDLHAAFELADTVGGDELRASLLTTEGVLRMNEGKLEEAADATERAVELAPPGSIPRIRALANLAVVDFTAGDVVSWRRRHDAAVAEATRTGDRPNLRWLEANSIGWAVYFGDWDEALRRADALRADGTHYQARTPFLIAAEIFVSRDAVANGLAMRDSALDLLPDGADAQQAMPTLMSAAWTSLIAGDDDRARELVLAASLRRENTRNRAPAVNATVPVAAMRVGLADEWREFMARNAPIKRQRATMLLLTGHVVEAADLWAEISPYDEAVARLHAARELTAAGRRAEADVQLQRGLAFYRAVGATRVIQDAEELLAAAS